MNQPISYGEALAELLLPPICIILLIILVIVTQIQTYDGYDSISENAIGKWSTSNSEENITIILLEDGTGNLIRNNTTQRLIWSSVPTLNDDRIDIKISETSPPGQIHVLYSNGASAFSVFINSNGNVLDWNDMTFYKIIEI